MRRKAMKKFALTLLLACPALMMANVAGYAANTNCTGALTGNINGNIVVPAGAACTLSDTTVTGNVQVLANASLTVDAMQQPATITGSVQATNCAFVLLEGG